RVRAALASCRRGGAWRSGPALRGRPALLHSGRTGDVRAAPGAEQPRRVRTPGLRGQASRRRLATPASAATVPEAADRAQTRLDLPDEAVPCVKAPEARPLFGAQDQRLCGVAQDRT